jgi:2,4-diketo-3-deoxy-L-fuconate hydrolase
MKLLRFGSKGLERPGMLDADGAVRDLSGIVADIDSAHVGPDALRDLARIDPITLPLAKGELRFGPPLVGIRKFIAIGLNYADHAAESNMPIPAEPIIFTKAISCIQGPDDPVVIPPDSVKTDWEVELGIVIGTRASHIELDDALAHVAGYLVVNDVSEREYQLDRGGTWDKGKGCDTFGPIGPWLVTADEIPDVGVLDMWLDVDGNPMQRGNTRTMIFGVAEIVSYVSRFLTLEPGDIIATGTPPGVGMGMKPPRFLKAGDHMTLGIAGLGQQNQDVVAWTPQGVRYS